MVSSCQWMPSFSCLCMGGGGYLLRFYILSLEKSQDPSETMGKVQPRSPTEGLQWNMGDLSQVICPTFCEVLSTWPQVSKCKKACFSEICPLEAAFVPSWDFMLLQLALPCAVCFTHHLLLWLCFFKKLWWNLVLAFFLVFRGNLNNIDQTMMG